MSSSFLMPSGCASFEPQAAHTRSFFSVRGSIARIRCPANSSTFSGACISERILTGFTRFFQDLHVHPENLVNPVQLTLVNKAIEPQLEHQKCPELMRVITFGANV